MEELDLDKLPRRMPYSVPEGTFDAIEKAVLASIAREREASVAPPDAVPVRRMRARHILPWLGGAVAFACPPFSRRYLPRLREAQPLRSGLHPERLRRRSLHNKLIQ